MSESGITYEVEQPGMIDLDLDDPETLQALREATGYVKLEHDFQTMKSSFEQLLAYVYAIDKRIQHYNGEPVITETVKASLALDRLGITVDSPQVDDFSEIVTP